MKRDFKKYAEKKFGDVTPEKLKEFEEIFIDAQKALLKGMLDEFDEDMDELFGKHNKAKNGNAQLIAYIASLKQFYINKNRYLKTLIDKDVSVG